MGFLESILQILINAFFVGYALLIIKKILTSYFFTRKKNEISKVRATLATSKLKLRARLKQRFNESSTFGQSELRSELEPHVIEINSLEFSSANDYRTLISKIIEINNTYKAYVVLNGSDQPKINPDEIQIAPELTQIREAYQQVFNFDRDMVVFIVDIINATKQYNELVVEFNKFTKLHQANKNAFELLENINLENFYIFEELCTQYKNNQESKILTESEEENNLDKVS